MTGESLTTSGEVKHIQWAFSLDDAPRLPLTGDNHPLRRELAKWMSWANLVTLLLTALIFAGWYFWSHRTIEEAPVMRPIKIVRYTDLGVPPSIARPAVPQINVAREVAKIAAPRRPSPYPNRWPTRRPRPRPSPR